LLTLAASPRSLSTYGSATLSREEKCTIPMKLGLRTNPDGGEEASGHEHLIRTESQKLSGDDRKEAVIYGCAFLLQTSLFF
jgi:hypothetical protein